MTLLWRGLAVAATALLLTACLPEPGGPATRSLTYGTSTDRPPRTATDTATDGARLAVDRTAFTVLKVDERGTYVSFAVELTNFSSTDLLSHARLTLHWSDGNGNADTTHGFPVLNLLPNSRTVTGDAVNLEITPDELRVEVAEDRWYPQRFATQLGYDFAAKVTTRSAITVTDGRVRADVTYEEPDRNTHRPLFDMVLIARNSEGQLLGALEPLSQGLRLSAGTHLATIEYHRSEWPAGADPATSEIVPHPADGYYFR